MRTFTALRASNMRSSGASTPILVTRFGQPYAEKDPSKLSNLTLGMIAFVYDLFRNYKVSGCDSLQPCLVANKQDHIPPQDPDPNVRKNDVGRCRSCRS